MTLGDELCGLHRDRDSDESAGNGVSESTVIESGMQDSIMAIAYDPNHKGAFDAKKGFL